MQEFRCHNCKFLLYSASGDIETEVICKNCRTINYPSRKNQAEGLRGKDFQSKSLQHNCYNCRTLLFRSIGVGIITTWCKKCVRFNKFDTDAIRRGTNIKREPDELKYIKLKESIAK